MNSHDHTSKSKKPNPKNNNKKNLVLDSTSSRRKKSLRKSMSNSSRRIRWTVVETRMRRSQIILMSMWRNMKNCRPNDVVLIYLFLYNIKIYQCLRNPHINDWCWPPMAYSYCLSLITFSMEVCPFSSTYTPSISPFHQSCIYSSSSALIMGCQLCWT